MSEAYRNLWVKMLPSWLTPPNFCGFPCIQSPPNYDDIKKITSHPYFYTVTQQLYVCSMQFRVFLPHTTRKDSRILTIAKNAQKSALPSDYITNTSDRRLSHHFPTQPCRNESFRHVIKGVHHTPDRGAYSTHRRREMHCYCCFLHTHRRVVRDWLW